MKKVLFFISLNKKLQWILTCSDKGFLFLSKHNIEHFKLDTLLYFSFSHLTEKWQAVMGKVHTSKRECMWLLKS